MKLLILSADDFGTSHTVNETIERLFRAGHITTAGIVTNASASADAIFRALECNMKVGIQWRLPEDMEDADSMDIMFELEHQISFLTDHGITPDHATNPSAAMQNSLDEKFMTEIFMICGGHNIPFRLPQTYNNLRSVVSPETNLYMEAHSMLMQPILESAWFLNVKLPMIVTSPHIELNPESYDALKAGCLKKLSVLSDGVSVICFSPCDESDESKNLYDNWQKRAWEARLLTDPEFIAALDGFALVDYTKAFDDNTYSESPT